MDERHVVAIDLGGTKATIAVVASDGRVLGRSVAPAPRTAPPEAIASFLARARKLPGSHATEAVGLALPGIVDTAGAVAWAAASIAEWQGAAARALLREAFEMPAAVRFDGYAATQGEAVFGAGRGHRSLVTFIVGTGLGAGVWLDGRVVEGHTGVAGAVGWDRWPVADGTLSEPVESLASGTGILAAARRAAPDADYADARAVFRAARLGDPVARAAVRVAATAAGVVAGGAIDLLAPEVVVWSGGVGARADFSALATRVARQSCQPFAVERTVFTRSRLGAESSIMGAAAAALATLEG
ncbi:ROK family protein [soil metagenome]